MALLYFSLMTIHLGQLLLEVSDFLYLMPYCRVPHFKKCLREG